MAKKDFTEVNTGRVYSAIEEATKPQKGRRSYSAEEKLEALETMQTSGKKGVRLPRINVAFSLSNFEYVHTMARVRGESLTKFINHLIEEHRKQNADVYEKAIEFRKQMDGE